MGVCQMMDSFFLVQLLNAREEPISGNFRLELKYEESYSIELNSKWERKKKGFWDEKNRVAQCRKALRR